MTVGVAIRVPGQGAVLACDSRVVDSDSGEIYTDADHKWGLFGTTAAVCSGALGGLWLDLREKPPRNLAELRERTTDLDAKDHDREYEILVYDRRKDRLVICDHQGDMTHVGGMGAVGSGGAIALGVLDAAKPPTTLEAAATLAQRACRIATRRNAFCGGRIRLVLVPAARRERARIR